MCIVFDTSPSPPINCLPGRQSEYYQCHSSAEKAGPQGSRDQIKAGLEQRQRLNSDFPSSCLFRILKQKLSKTTILDTFYFLPDNCTPAGKLVLHAYGKDDEHNQQKTLWKQLYFYLFICCFLLIFKTGHQCFFSFIIIFKRFIYFLVQRLIPQGNSRIQKKKKNQTKSIFKNGGPRLPQRTNSTNLGRKKAILVPKSEVN